MLACVFAGPWEATSLLLNIDIGLFCCSSGFSALSDTCPKLERMSDGPC